MTLKRRLASMFTLAAAAAALSPPAAAATAVYAFGGVIDENNVSNPSHDFTSFTGHFSFDTLRADIDPADHNNGGYPMGGSGLYGMEVVFNDGTVFDVDSLGPRYGLAVHVAYDSEVGQPSDHGHFDVDGAVLGQSDRFLSLWLGHDFATDALPVFTGGFDLSFFDQALFSYHGLAVEAPFPGQPAAPEFGAFGHLTSLSCTSGCRDIDSAIPPVPEPETYALILAGLGMSTLVARRRRRAG